MVAELGISRGFAKVLYGMGYRQVSDFAALDVPALLDAGIGWGPVVMLLRALAQRDVKVQFQVPGKEWGPERWQRLVRELVDAGIVTWEEVAICVLGEMNPPQVGTSTASNANFKSQYPPKKTMQAVMEWFYRQPGKCATCGSRLHLEADHIKSKKEFEAEGKDASEADTLANLQLLCKRCNVGKRESHVLSGLSFHTAQAALMWILLVLRPATYEEFKRLCRRHGLTMADVRFQEAWAMAEWLKRDGLYP